MTECVLKFSQPQLSSHTGTFGPLLLAFKGATEKFAAIHNHWMIKLNDLVKEVAKYTEELQRKHKKVKEDEAGTLEAVKLIQVGLFVRSFAGSELRGFFDGFARPGT